MTYWSLRITVPALVGALALFAAPQQAEEDKVSPDRPGFGTPTTLVRPGMMQFETGFARETDSSEGLSTRLFVMPTSLLRFGMTDRLELRLESGGILREREQGPDGILHRNGAGDVSFAAKLRLWDERLFLPAVTLIPSLSSPFGSPGHSSGGYDPKVILAWAKDLPAEFGIGGNLSYGSVTADLDRATARDFSLGVERGFGPITGFVEAYQQRLGTGKDADKAWAMQTGAAFGLWKNFAFDISLGRAITNNAPDFMIGFGLSMRSPWRKF